MYYPYFRGKQFELIAVRDTAELLAQAGFLPIIEPVKAQLKGLTRTLDAVCDAGGSVIVVINPGYGDHAGDGGEISELLADGFADRENVLAGIMLNETMTVDEAIELYQAHGEHDPFFIHAGFMEAKALSDALGEDMLGSKHIFFEENCTKLYRKHFAGAYRVLVRDGFNKRRNADYSELERFTDLHVTYTEEGMNGFGDFLTVGNDFSEGGGPAYAVAIHLTFIDPEKDDEMYVYHFVSDRKNTPTDPAGKFSEALTKLKGKFDSGESHLFHGSALQAFLDLHEKGHFPGLGQVKKLSMVHHIETIKDYFD